MQVEEMVQSVMITKPITRNSNTLLLAEVLNQFGHCGLTTQQIEIMLKFPLESITRARRKLVSTGDPKYQADKEVQDMREERRQEITTQYGGGRQYCQSLLNKMRQEKIQQQPNLPF